MCSYKSTHSSFCLKVWIKKKLEEEIRKCLVLVQSSPVQNALKGIVDCITKSNLLILFDHSSTYLRSWNLISCKTKSVHQKLITFCHEKDGISGNMQPWIIYQLKWLHGALSSDLSKHCYNQQILRVFEY